MEKDRNIILIGSIKAYKNYLRVLLKLYLKRRESFLNDNVLIKVILRDGREMSVPYGWVTSFARMSAYQNNNISSLSLTKEGISFLYKGQPVLIYPGRFGGPNEVFMREDYSFLNVAGRDVIDIGMNIGDSTIYFALNGAKRVIGLEPYPYSFSYAEKNVKLNNLQNVIILNAGYGKDSNIIVDDSKIPSNASSLKASNKGGKEIPIYSLETLIHKYEIRDAVLKMDCEGCEYSLLDEGEDVLKRLEMIQIEYHYGYEKLKEKLEKSGMKVKYTKPVKVFNSDASNPNMTVGFIYAKRE